VPWHESFQHAINGGDVSMIRQIALGAAGSEMAIWEARADYERG
jgi:hypothetical protein